MPKHLIKRYIPTPERIAQLPGIHRFGPRITEPMLWHINRRSISGAMFVGLFCALIPLPGQMLFAALFAIWLRVNLPLSIALTWLTNPFTMVPILYSSYWLGAHLYGVPMLEIGQIKDAFVAMTTHLFSTATLPPTHGVFSFPAMLLGLLAEALILATLGTLLMRALWRYHVVHAWRTRHQDRAPAATPPANE